ncbi:MAG: hypothetical protein M1826_002054 [Phylliscum demangeonii]|nr:MAG: hypothetical protein M1826_002054 [Phylliscum demangeonii]
MSASPSIRMTRSRTKAASLAAAPGLAIEAATPAAPAVKPTKAANKRKADTDEGGRGEPAAPPPKRMKGGGKRAAVAKPAEPTKAPGRARNTATPAAAAKRTNKGPAKTKVKGRSTSKSATIAEAKRLMAVATQLVASMAPAPVATETADYPGRVTRSRAAAAARSATAIAPATVPVVRKKVRFADEEVEEEGATTTETVPARTAAKRAADPEPLEGEEARKRTRGLSAAPVRKPATKKPSKKAAATAKTQEEPPVASGASSEGEKTPGPAPSTLPLPDSLPPAITPSERVVAPVPSEETPVASTTIGLESLARRPPPSAVTTMGLESPARLPPPSAVTGALNDVPARVNVGTAYLAQSAARRAFLAPFQAPTPLSSLLPRSPARRTAARADQDPALRTPSPHKPAPLLDLSADRAQAVASSARRQRVERAFLAAVAPDPSPPTWPTPRLRPYSLDSPFAAVSPAAVMAALSTPPPGLDLDEMLASCAATTATDEAVRALAPAAFGDGAAPPSASLQEGPLAPTTPLLLPRSEPGPAATPPARPTTPHAHPTTPPPLLMATRPIDDASRGIPIDPVLMLVDARAQSAAAARRAAVMSPRMPGTTTTCTPARVFSRSLAPMGPAPRPATPPPQAATLSSASFPARPPLTAYVTQTTVTRVPLAAADDDDDEPVTPPSTPSAPRFRPRSTSTYSSVYRLPTSEDEDSDADEPAAATTRPSRATAAATATRTSAPTPTTTSSPPSVAPSSAGSPPPQPLRGAVVYVDVHTAEGADASSLFTGMLVQMGARVVRNWSWNPGPVLASGASSPRPPRVGITHVVYKDGGVRTLEKVRQSAGAVACVGVAWVLEYVFGLARCDRDRPLIASFVRYSCHDHQAWLHEAAYAVDPSLVPRGGQRRRRSMEPRALSLTTASSTAAEVVPRRAPTPGLMASPFPGSMASPSPGSMASPSPGSMAPPSPVLAPARAPAPSTPAASGNRPEPVLYSPDRYAPEQYSPDHATTIATPYYLHATNLLQQSAGPPIDHHAPRRGRSLAGGDGTVGDGSAGGAHGPVATVAAAIQRPPTTVRGAVESGPQGERVRLALLAARRRSLMYAPKVGSPLARGDGL